MADRRCPKCWCPLDWDECDSCNGEGYPGESEHECSACDGEGLVLACPGCGWKRSVAHDEYDELQDRKHKPAPAGGEARP